MPSKNEHLGVEIRPSNTGREFVPGRVAPCLELYEKRFPGSKFEAKIWAWKTGRKSCRNHNSAWAPEAFWPRAATPSFSPIFRASPSDLSSACAIDRPMCAERPGCVSLALWRVALWQHRSELHHETWVPRRAACSCCAPTARLVSRRTEP